MWALVVIGAATTVIVDRSHQNLVEEVKNTLECLFSEQLVASILKNRFTPNKFVFRAVAGFLAGVKASHHSTDKESLDRLDLGVTQS